MAKKVLIFSVAYPPFIGGAELAIKEITDRINDIEFDLITLRFDSKLPEIEKMGNITVYRIGFAREQATMADLVQMPLKLNKIFFPFTAFFKAVSLHRKKKYDAIWAMMAAYAGFAAMFFKILYPRVPYLLTLQEGDPIEHILDKVKFFRPLFNRIFTKADHLQAISYYLADWGRTMGFKGKLSIVPNAVATAHFSQLFTNEQIKELKNKLNKKENDIFVVTTSRLVTKNAVDDVIKSLQYLPVNIKFLILGTGPDEQILRELAREIKVDDRVIFYGHVDHADMPLFLKISDIFIRPSISEGLGNSFLEAMAAGLPVIATPVGGIPDFLFDPKANPDKEPTGLFCKVRDPQSIAKQVNKFIGDQALREKIIFNAKKLVFSKYDWDMIASDMNNIFKLITAK